MNFFKTKFNKKFFAGLLVVLVVFGFSNLIIKNTVFADQEFPVNDGLGDPNDTTQHTTDNVGVAKKNNGHVNLKPRDGFLRVDSIGAFGVFLLTEANNFLKWTVSADLYENVFFSPAARTGVMSAWRVVRGFVNMFYLLLLIFLAISTILQINKFSDKKLFVKVIFSAILVNFSLPITIFVIDASNMFMVYFASAINDQSLANIFFTNSEWASQMNKVGFVLSAAKSTVEFIIYIIMAVMLLYTGVALLIRLIAYWVLIILSPLAFFSLAIPGGGGFNEWKDKLVAYSVFGPVMLFFIWLALSLTGALNKAFILYRGTSSMDTFTIFLTSYITALYLLYYGHDKAKSWGAKAGDTVGTILNKGGQYAVKAGKGAAMVTPMGAAGYLAGRGIKSTAEAQYTGMKAKMMQGGLTKRLFKEGRKEVQEDKNAVATAKWEAGGLPLVGKKRKEAGKFARDQIEAKRMAAKEKAMADAGFDWSNRDKVTDLAKNGSGLAKKIANIKRAENGWAGVDDSGNIGAKEVLDSIGDNKRLRDEAIRNLEKKNQYSLAKYYENIKLNGGTEGEIREAEKYFEKKLKNAMQTSGLNHTKQLDRDNYMQNIYENYADALVGEILKSKKTDADRATLINENKEVANIAHQHSSYIFDGLSDVGKKRLNDMLNDQGRAVLSRDLLGVQNIVAENDNPNPNSNPNNGNGPIVDRHGRPFGPNNPPA